MSMIYYQDDVFIIRDMIESDGPAFVEAELRQGWHPDISGYELRLRHQAAGKCIALVAECDGRPVGRAFVYRYSEWGPFAGKGLPQIVDLCVLLKYQNRGIGTRLMDAAEAVAARYADRIHLGVGLHSGYGNAQRMYIKRGYIPDGTGVWFRNAVCPPYSDCRNDDDLILYLSKRLKLEGGAGNV